ncbi:MAG: PASTA domain-containing protein [Candidatus Kapabacteria bacterium]|nr:PASTA domain-containing protein [Candidatus Kapabacteria bacterium]
MTEEEKEKMKDDIRAKTSISSSQNFSLGVKSLTTSNNLRNRLKLFSVFIMFFISIMILVLIFDKLLIPYFVHERTKVKVPLIEGYSFEKVFITLSKGTETVGVPNLIGQNLRQVRISLNKLGIRISNVDYIFNEQFGKDTIVLQSKSYGSKIEYGDTLRLSVSKGKDNNSLVPNFIGESLSSTQSKLESINLKLGKVSFRYDETFVVGTILEQSLSPNSTLLPNSSIDFVVASNKK